MQGDDPGLNDPGLAVARIALGCGNFGRVGSEPAFFGQGMTEDEAFALMDAAWEAGLDWFDTADAYGGGRSERAIGRWMAARGVRPRLTTKTFNPMEAGADHGLKPERVARQLRSSLDRLGVGHVDLYLAHEYDSDVPLAEIAGSRGTSLAGLALGWLLADERVTQVVIGPGRPEHLAPVAEALRHPVTGAERAEIEAAVAGLSQEAHSQEAGQ